MRLGDGALDLRGIARRFADRIGDLIHRCGHFLQRRGVLFIASGQIVGRIADFRRALFDDGGGGDDAADCFAQFLHRAVEILTQRS
jgi:hypothetical protein